uniref:Uncharacterized protein n=1 Tax=Anguilla anguilla TaxID=7936 RepID=A0A0E9V2C9_ANGAN
MIEWLIVPVGHRRSICTHGTSRCWSRGARR